MAKGQIAEDKKRVVSIMPKDLVEVLEKLASEDGRSLSNYIVKVCENHVKVKQEA
jgi:predicted DNA-binding protein